jgi:hypothetical protein
MNLARDNVLVCGDVGAMTAPRGSALYSGFRPWLFRLIVVVFPVTVLLLVQINALRYQSDLITWMQHAWLALDLGALGWFFERNPVYGVAGRVRIWRQVHRVRWNSP